MKIIKSSRHAKITGDFGEAVILYWLSKYGFECASVDHTGIDIIAHNRYTKQVMGISVKSRTRTEGAADDVTIPNDDFDKAKAACEAFGCIPYFAVVVDKGEVIRAFILPMSKLLTLSPKRKAASYWKMAQRDLDLYAGDPEIQAFEFRTRTARWWGQEDGPANGSPPFSSG